MAGFFNSVLHNGSSRESLFLAMNGGRRVADRFSLRASTEISSMEWLRRLIFYDTIHTSLVAQGEEVVSNKRHFIRAAVYK